MQSQPAGNLDDAVRRYLLGRGADPPTAARAAAACPTPITVTKRGALFYAVKGA